MSTEENKAAVRRLNEAINRGDWSVIPELFAPDYVFHSTQEARGHEGIKQSFASLRAAFPDYHEKIEHMIAEGDMVAATYTLTGTFQGKLGDSEPTGKKFSMPIAVLARFEKGKQVEAWSYYDSLAWGRQLGISLSPPG
jgi:steroid delta-isomerase-like uncharacterized protein